MIPVGELNSKLIFTPTGCETTSSLDELRTTAWYENLLGDCANAAHASSVRQMVTMNFIVYIL